MISILFTCETISHHNIATIGWQLSISLQIFNPLSAFVCFVFHPFNIYGHTCTGTASAFQAEEPLCKAGRNRPSLSPQEYMQVKNGLIIWDSNFGHENLSIYWRKHMYLLSYQFRHQAFLFSTQNCLRVISFSFTVNDETIVCPSSISWTNF